MRQSNSELSDSGDPKEPTNPVDKNKQANQETNTEFRFVILADGKPTRPKGPRAIVMRQRRARKPINGQTRATALLPMERPEPLMLYGVSPRRRSSWPILIVSILLLLIGGGFFSMSNALIPLRNTFPGLVSATITITPNSHQLQKSSDLEAVTTPPVATQQQVPARLLSFTTDTQSITVPASGTSTIPATYASGALVFKNILSTEQTISAGTVFIDKNGIKVTNEQDAGIPAAQLLFNGSVIAGTITVPAQALVPGDQGNIQPLDFNGIPSSISGVTVENTAPFFGGQEQQTYRYVEQSDIDHAANTLQKTLAQKGRVALLSKMLPDERLINQIQYTRSVSSSSKAGETVGGDIIVTVSVTCFGEVYNQRLAQTMVENQLRAEGTSTLTAEYKLVGPISAQVVSIKQLDLQGTISLQIQAKGLWVYQIPESKLQAMVKQVVDKSKKAAQTILEHEAGVKKAQIDLSLIAGDILPQNPRQITLYEALTP
jgi:hypothetical protein